MEALQKSMRNIALYGNSRGERPIGEVIMSSLMNPGACETSIDTFSESRSLTDRLTNEKQKLEGRLSQVNDVLTQLAGDPKTQKLIDAISRLGHF